MRLSEIRFSRKFISDSFWSLFGNITSVLAGLVSVKIITSYVEVNEFGQAALVLGILALLNNIVIGPLMTAHLRVYFEYLERGMARWFSSMFNWVLGAAGIIAALLYSLLAILFYLFGTQVYVKLALPAALLVIAQPYMNSVNSYLEAHRLQRRLAILNLLQKACQPVILILLLTIAVPGAYAIVLAQSLVILPLFLIFRIPKEQNSSDTRPDDHRGEFINLRNSIVSFGWALPLGYIAHWILSTGDRYIIEHFMTVEDVGIYAMNYGFWSMPYLMLNGWLEILTRPLLYEKAVKSDWQGLKQVLLRRIIFGTIVSIIGTLLLLLYGKLIATILLGSNYWVGWQLMITIATAHCFFVIGYSIVPLFLAAKKPRMILVATSAAAAFNIILNIGIIPKFGILGAALSTLAAYMIWASVLAIGAHTAVQRSNSYRPGLLGDLT